jgi:hypothetical protein
VSPADEYTDSTGNFSFKVPNIDPGTQGKLYVHADGFEPVEKNFTVSDSLVHEDIRLDPVLAQSPRTTNASVVAGRVIDSASGAGISHASVSLAGRPESNLTDDNGNFRIRIGAPIPAGELRLQVKKRGCTLLDQLVQASVENLVLQLSCAKTHATSSDDPGVGIVGGTGQPSGVDLIRQEIGAIRSGQHEAMPPARASEVAAGNQTSTTVINSTAITLMFFLDGPVSQQLTIPAGESRTLYLPPGKYEAAARAFDESVVPYYGQQSYNSNTQYSERFSIARIPSANR